MVGNQTGVPQSSCQTMRGVPEELGPLGVTDDKKDVKKDGAEHQTGVAQPSSATTVIVAELAALAIEQAEVTVEPEQLVGNRKDVTEEKIEGGGAQGDFTVEQAEVIGARRHMAEDDGPGEPNATSEDISSLSDGWVVKVGSKTLKCTACNVPVSLQATNKFGNMRRHLKSPAHIAKSSDSYTAQYKSLEAKFPGVFVHHGQEAHCSDCGKKGILMLAGKNLLRNAASHVESDRHRHCAKKSGGSTSKKITSFFTRGRKTSNEWLDYTICHGYANTETMFHENSKEVKVDLTLLHRDLDPGFDNGEMSWWAEPHHEGSSGMKGTFRSAKCKKVALTNDICSHCAAIPKLQSFRKRALLPQTRVMDKREATTVRNQYLIREELMNKCDSQSRKLGEDRAEKYFLKSKWAIPSTVTEATRKVERIFKAWCVQSHYSPAGCCSSRRKTEWQDRAQGYACNHCKKSECEERRQALQGILRNVPGDNPNVGWSSFGQLCGHEHWWARDSFGLPMAQNPLP